MEAARSVLSAPCVPGASRAGLARRTGAGVGALRVRQWPTLAWLLVNNTVSLKLLGHGGHFAVLHLARLVSDGGL